MLRIPRPILYLRVASGGRSAAQAQEAEVRRTLDELGIGHHAMHVSCDMDVPGTLVGPVLGLLIEEARLGMVRTVIATEVARLGTAHSVLVHVLNALEGVGVEIATTDYLRHDAQTCARLRHEGTAHALAPQLLTLGFGAAQPSREHR